jgi:hypothetical protein
MSKVLSEDLDDAAKAIGMRRSEVVRVTRDANGDRLVLTFDGNVVQVDEDGNTTPAGRVSDEELAKARREAEEPIEAPASAKAAPAKK